VPLDAATKKTIIDDYATKFNQYTNAQFFLGVTRLLSMAVGVAFVSRVAKNFQDYFVNVVTQRLGAQLYSDGIRHSLSLPFQVFEDQRSGETLGKLQKVRADVEVTCFGYEGIDAVKDALRAAEKENTADTQVKVKLVSPPLYVLTSQCLEKATGITLLERAITQIESSITGAGGSCVTRMAPKAVTENDDAELQALMAKSERENAEVSGDEEMSESDDNPVTETI